MKDLSDTSVLDTRFPGYAWMPRWTRKYWTPQTVVTLALALFSAGAWFDNWRHRDALRDAVSAVKAQSDAATASIQKQTDQLVRKSDLAVLESHVNDLWAMRVDIDAELAHQEAIKKAKRRKP